MPAILGHRARSVQPTLAPRGRAAFTTWLPLARMLPAVAAALAGLLTALPWLDERTWPAAWLGMALWIAVTSGQPPHQAFRLWMLGGLFVLAVWFHWLPTVAANHLRSVS